MGNKVKAIGYCRILNKYDKLQGLESQEKQIQKAATNLNAEIVQWFGFQDCRSHEHGLNNLDRALKFCKANPSVRLLIVADAIRISCSVDTYLFWKTAFKRIGVNIVLANQNGYGSSFDDFFSSLVIALSKLDSAERSARIKRALAAKKAEKA